MTKLSLIKDDWTLTYHPSGKDYPSVIELSMMGEVKGSNWTDDNSEWESVIIKDWSEITGMDPRLIRRFVKKCVIAERKHRNITLYRCWMGNCQMTNLTEKETMDVIESALLSLDAETPSFKVTIKIQ